MYLNFNDHTSVHNLTDITIPTTINLILNLGLKFSFNLKPNFRTIQTNLREGMRKIAWQIFYACQGETSEMDELAKITHKIKKTLNIGKTRCPIENEIFSDSFIPNTLSKLRQNTMSHNLLHEFLIEELRSFIRVNELVIKMSDKNAGICVMRKTDYNNEVHRQLNDLSVYYPSTNAEFQIKTFDFVDKTRSLKNTLLKDLKINSIIPTSYKAAKFYTLPKIHKKFDNFPVGRPISSTINCANKGISMALDSELQPLSMNIPNLILDTPHLLLSLNNIQLRKDRKYILVTADIQSMYLDLPIGVCKRNCMEFFTRYKNVTNFPFPISEPQLKQLLNLSLDYSFLEFENEFYYQHKGIQMGNSSSVSIANITAAVELMNMTREEIVFMGRFIDDILKIIDVTDIVDIDSWLKQLFTHSFLKFTYEYSETNVNFLDLNISLENNEIVTKLYSKPMSKHEFLHFSSNHPSHIMKALPYSCGLRIIRSCSKLEDRIKELDLLMNKFKRRKYPTSKLTQVYDRLLTIDRISLLAPKSKLLCHYLSIHNPQLLQNVNVKENSQGIENHNNKRNIYVVTPFHNNIRQQGSLIRESFLRELCNSRNEAIKSCVEDININVAFKVSNPLKRFIDKWNVDRK